MSELLINDIKSNNSEVKSNNEEINAKCVCITSRCLKLVCKSRCNPREYCPEAIGKRLAEILHDKKANILISDLDGRELYEGSIGDLLFHLRYNPYDHLYDHLNKVYVSSMCVSNNTIHIVVEN